MQEERIATLCDWPADPDGRYVLYWMQASQRAAFNPALEHAVSLANERGQGVVVGFGLDASYPDANARHFAFMLEGLAETARTLHGRGIRFVMRRGSPDTVALALARDASIVVCDRGYLRHQRRWRDRVALEARRRVVQVEGDVVVPVEAASGKHEYAARTLRPRIAREKSRFLETLGEREVAVSSLPLQVTGDLDPRDAARTLDALDVDRSVGPVGRFRGGTSQARQRLEAFLRSDVAGYADARNDPSAPRTSNLSPYLHFGQVSPVEVALKVAASRNARGEDADGFLEELIVRRELSVNHVHYAPDDYDRYACLPAWARRTLAAHRSDERAHCYTRTQLESGETHDAYWNAAMREMRATGYMHNYMRMYWGKKILEWTRDPEEAFDTTLALNNKWFLDGRDPASYGNVGWIFGLHDRPWTERPIFGTVRYMAASGLERKFDIDTYVEWTRALE